MNFYLVFILSFITIVYFLENLADWFNLKHLKDEIPNEFAELYDHKKYQESLQYQRENAYFELFRKTFFFVVTLLFILLGGFNWIDQFANSFGYHQLITSLIFIGTLGLLRSLLQLPFQIYDTFVLEDKFGFNKTSIKTFFQDLIKSSILAVVLGGLIFVGLVSFFEYAGPRAWLYSWLAVTTFQVLLLYLAPTIILPLFNKFSPLEEGPLRTAIEKYASTRNFHLDGIFTMDGSTRSTKANAFFTGFGRFRRLVLFDTLISKQTTEELVAILAHEIGHFEKKHILKSILLSVITTGIMFYAFSFFINNRELFRAFRMENISTYASLVFIGFLFSPILRIMSIFTQKLSRKYEFEADEFSKLTYGHPEALISALKKLSMDNFSHLTPHSLKVILDYTHPPVLQRIKALRVK